MLWALFLMIGAIWAVFLIPPMWADRQSAFRSKPRVASRAVEGSGLASDVRTTTPFTQDDVVAGARHHEILARRRRWLTGLALTVLGTLAVFLMFRGTGLLVLHVMAVLALFVYVATLRRLTLRRINDLASLSIYDQARPEYMYSPPARAASYR